MNPWTQDRIYRRTSCADAALMAPQAALPSDYRRLLDVIRQETHLEAIHRRFCQYSHALLADWLGELEELGYLRSRLADYTEELDFTLLLESKPEGPPPPDEPRHLEHEAQAACAALYDTGSYLSAQRLSHNTAPRPRPEDTVVLIVEDDPDQLALAEVRVRMAGYGVRLARNRMELRQDFAGQALPALVLLDVMLPDGNGFDVLSEMRSCARLAAVPVIMLSALEDVQDIRRGLALGAEGYMTKPYSKRVLERMLCAVLGHGDDAQRQACDATRVATTQ